VLNSIRVKFIRGEEVKFISHLDLMKAFERALRRSGIPVAYSQGFNPHPVMVFGLPLSVGVTSEAEYADFDLAEAVEPDEFVERLNAQLPPGLKIVDARKRQRKENIMASVVMASYDVLVSVDGKWGIDEMAASIEQLMQKPVIMAKKETKSGVKDVDIKPMIRRLEVKAAEELADEHCGCQRLYHLFMLLSAGSKSNLKPELLLGALNDLTGLGLKIRKVHRTGLFVGKEEKVVDPLDACS